MKRNGTAVWKGTGKEGTGLVSAGSGLFTNADYSSASRFENAKGTNPEELIAAAHAGCFTMKLAYVLAAAGFTADDINTDCYVTIEAGTINKSELICRAKISGIDAAKFEECANEAKTNCPVSKALNCEIMLDAALV